MTPRKTARAAKVPEKIPEKIPASNGRRRAPSGAKSAASGSRRAPAVARPAAGERLRTELAKDGDPYGVAVLINQAARCADRLEVLDRLLSGDGGSWLRLDWSRVDEVSPKVVQVRVDVRVDSAVLEERQQATVLRHLLAQIHKQRAGIPGGGDDEDDVMDGI
jgi:hypothetical protein